MAGKARTEGLGVVSEDQNAWQNLMYLGSGGQGATAGTAIDVLSNTHPITQPFATGALTVYSASDLMGYWNTGSVALPRERRRSPRRAASPTALC